MAIRGSVDAISVRAAVGWIADSTSSEPIPVNARFQGRILGQAIANRLRPDLATAGFGTGHHGFEIPFGPDIDPVILPAITVHAGDSDTILPRTNLAGLHDFQTGLINLYPAAGRSRSVFGGLWADRYDAGRVLAGRLAVGTLPTALEGPLTEYVARGVVTLADAFATPFDVTLMDTLDSNEPLDPTANLAARQLVETLPDILFSPSSLALLQALLDDVPRAIRIMPIIDNGSGFAQPSTAEALPSPAECLLAVVGQGVEIDIVRGSHMLPEFNAGGQSRWTTPGGVVGLEMALAHGASVDTLALQPNELMVVDPGTLYRLRRGEGGGGVAVWLVPLRQTPQRVLARNSGRFQLRTEGGALIAI
jgi:hypothetical protein